MDDLLAPPSGGKLVRVSTKDLVLQRLPRMLEALGTKRESMLTRFRQAAMGVALSPNVSQCDPESVAAAIYAAARLNLIPDPVLKQAYVVPFKGKATLILGYPGLVELARRACPGLIMHTGAVYENDDYQIREGTDQRVTISRTHWMKGERPGNLICTFCAFKPPQSYDYTTVIVPRYKLDDLAAAKGGKFSPWTTHFPEMGEKTAIRRASRFWSMAAETNEEAYRQLREAITIDEAEELPPCPEAEDAEGKAMLDGLEEGQHRVGSMS